MSLTEEEKRARKREYQRTYRRNQKKKSNDLVDLLANLGKDAKDIIIEIIRAANSNPLLGIFVSVVGVDVLSRLKVIDAGTAAGLYVAIGAIEGAEVGGQIIADLASVFKLFSKSPSNNLVTPSATTLVYGQGNLEDLQTLLGKKS